MFYDFKNVLFRSYVGHLLSCRYMATNHSAFYLIIWLTVKKKVTFQLRVVTGHTGKVSSSHSVPSTNIAIVFLSQSLNGSD